MPSGNASVLNKENGADRLEMKILGGLKGGLVNGNDLHGCRHFSALSPFTACFRVSRGCGSLRLFRIKLDSAGVSDFLCMGSHKGSTSKIRAINTSHFSVGLSIIRGFPERRPFFVQVSHWREPHVRS